MVKISESLSNFLNLIRWIAAFLVVITHIRTLLFVDIERVSNSNIFISFFYFISSLGGEAVIVFFVLSGYLVGGKTFYEFKNNSFNWKIYFINRFSRLYIVLIPALIIGGFIDYLGINYFNAYPFLFMSIFTWGISYTDRYFIDYFLETKDIAIYAILAMVAGIGQIIGQIYFMYVNPKILKMFEENQNNALEYLSKTLKGLGLIFILLTLVSFFIPIQIYEILLEPTIIRDNYYFYTFIILLIGIFATVYQTAFSMYLNLFKKLNILAYIYLIAFIANIIGNFFIKDYGIIAAGISTLVAYIVILLLQILYVSKYIKMEINNV